VDSYALVHTAVEQPPYRGEVLIWHLGRGLSILFGAILIGLTYLTSLHIFPADRRRALLSAALIAFVPALLFHSSVLSYESLSAVLTALFLLVALQTLKQPNRLRWWIALGVLTGLSITTKYSAVLLPLEIIFVIWLSNQFEAKAEAQAKLQPTPPLTNQQTNQPTNSPTPQLYKLPNWQRILVAALATLIASGWWFGFVAWEFNTIDTQGPVVGLLQPLLVGDASDTTSVQVAGFLFGQQTVANDARPPMPRNYLQLARSFSESFWAAPVAGQFGPFILPLVYSVLALLALAGLGRVWRQSDRRIRLILSLLLVHTFLIVPLLLIRVLLSYDPREVAQGRHLLLPAASAIAVLLVWGWDQWSPKLSWLAVGGLLLWTIFGQLGWAVAAYPPPIPVWPQQVMAAPPAYPQETVLADGIKLVDVSHRVLPDALEVTLRWESLATIKADYLVELSLLDSAGHVVGYNLSQPVNGRYPTRAWEPGDTIEDTHLLPLLGALGDGYRLQLRLLTRAGEVVPHTETTLDTVSLSTTAQPDPCTIWPPPDSWLDAIPLRPDATFTIVNTELPLLKLGSDEVVTQNPFHSVGDFHTFLVGPDWPTSARLLSGDTDCGLLNFDIPPRNFTVPAIPQPLEANFNNEIQLLGYELPARRIQPGQRLPLTLYWRSLAYMGEDYNLFANPLDRDQQRWGGYDRRPRDGYSTLRWVPGEVITDPFGIPIDANAPDGIYTIDLGFYRQTESGPESLPLFQDGQAIDQHSLRLGPIKIGGPPLDLTLTEAHPEFPINESFGNQITLLGYDEPSADSRQPSAISRQQSTVSEQPSPTSQPTNQPASQPANQPTPQLPNSTNSTNATNSLTLTLYWQADTTPAADYTVFLHLRDESNQTIAQKDNPPAGGQYPTSLWDPGEMIKDELTLPLDDVPPGRYTPVVGLYN
ncbi:MAG: glycosyltransferase family 39 protein, partial [Anaerolineae bacterium]|nr:glycosyltransferase family 39 protein [Anaerolineae bacterium]